MLTERERELSMKTVTLKGKSEDNDFKDPL